MYLYSKNSSMYYTFLLPEYLLQKVKKFKNVKFQYFLKVDGTRTRTQRFWKKQNNLC